MVFVHAFPLNRQMWSPQLAALGGSARCIAPDLRGFGASPALPPFSMERYADDIAIVLTAAGVAQATIVAASWGGYISFALWRRHRHRVRALALVGTRATADSAEAARRRRALIDLAIREGSEAVAAAQVPALVGSTTLKERREIVEHVRRLAAAAPVATIVGALEAMIARPDATPLLPSIDVPTLIVTGEEDAVNTAADAGALQAGIRDSRIERVPGAGHLPSVESPGAFNEMLGSFLRGLATPKAGAL